MNIYDSIEKILEDMPELKKQLSEHEKRQIVKYIDLIYAILEKKIEKMPDDLISHSLARLQLKYKNTPLV
jgi:CRISPR/Cas system CSM-associated protein Csm2 small subunit